MKPDQKRSYILLAVVCVVLVFFVGALFRIQILRKDSYKKNTVSTYQVSVDAARGEILDRNGSPLITNRQGNSIVFNYAYFPTDQAKRNKIILSLINLFEQYEQEYTDVLPITLNADGTYSFEEDRDSDIEWLKSSDMLDLNSYATAENCMTALIKRYSLEEYSKSDAIKIASVCVGMKRAYFSTTYPFTFSEDVPTELVTIVMENSATYVGVENEIVAYREYTDGTLAPHILGRTSGITAETYAEKKAETEAAVEAAEEEGASEEEITAIKLSGYTLTDDYGSSGIELAMEEYLKGSRGLKTVSIDNSGNVTEEYDVEPVQGSTVILTIDSGLQKVAQDSLKKRVSTLDVETSLTAAAAVVVQNVNTGEILACATYPSYDNSTWSENYSTWASDTVGSPLWNRATMSTYEPGSTFKPCVAIAGLQENVITSKTTLECTGYYTYFEDVTFACANYTAHGELDVTHAIEESCNCFFYETGRLLGIDKIDKWATAFGLGQKTGVEISEATGLLASKEEREADGETWHPGDTVQAAIGQSDHQFTLLQLCNYCATIANGGTRYVPHFVKAVMSYDYSETLLTKEPEVANQIDIDAENLELVREGMHLVATEGFCASAFADLPVEAAAKTGTSEIKKIINGQTIEGNNGFLITYAPYDDPEIAIAIVVETADKGSLCATIAADIYNYYFSEKNTDSVQLYNTLLK